MWIDELEKITKVRVLNREDSRPRALVEPSSEEEVSEVIHLLSSEGLKGHFIGTGTHHIGERVEADVYLSMSFFTGLREASMADLYVKVGAGTLFKDLNAALRREQMWLPFAYHGSVGGFASLNIPDHFSLFYGYPRDWLLGARIVTGKGEVINTGSKNPKFSSGYKIWKAMSGSLGKLGGYLEITLKTVPLPEEVVPVEVKYEQVADVISRGAHGITLLKADRETIVAWFAGHSSYVRRSIENFRVAEVEECSGDRVNSVLTARGKEIEVARRLKGECIVSYYGTGYSRVFNGEELEELRSKGYTAYGEKGCTKDCLPSLGQAFHLLKSALDPEGVLV
ncbi:FAD-binding oxidoreductase [Metallosphaera tengchongensis]|uniref:FAD-binding oxidoreductase n=1 Tax=Metallosphaera tengchongensis TaxID=1532350 RepID=A0A6N0NVU8_9CREN|nr:FAD-binding oxidoreductase [Metallosphaera tengchongensis]QKR00345.1 FAD-binding oxidoreductase [Metallosphaera tengchongensis]